MSTALSNLLPVRMLMGLAAKSLGLTSTFLSSQSSLLSIMGTLVAVLLEVQPPPVPLLQLTTELVVVVLYACNHRGRLVR